MKKIFLQLIFITTLVGLWAAIAHAENQRPFNFFGSFEYYLSDGVKKPFEDSRNNTVNAYQSLGIPASGNVNATGGYGIRAGIFFPIPQSSYIHLGGSLGYIMGPTVDYKFDASGGLISGEVREKFKTNYIRLLAEGNALKSINNRVGLKLGMGLGVANARSYEDVSGTGSFAHPNVNSKSQNSTGFTWEISPSLVLNFNQTFLELGMRYAQFPTIKGNGSNASELKWSPIGFFASLGF